MIISRNHHFSTNSFVLTCLSHKPIPFLNSSVNPLLHSILLPEEGCLAYRKLCIPPMIQYWGGYRQISLSVSLDGTVAVHLSLEILKKIHLAAVVTFITKTIAYIERTLYVVIL